MQAFTHWYTSKYSVLL